MFLERHFGKAVQEIWTSSDVADFRGYSLPTDMWTDGLAVPRETSMIACFISKFSETEVLWSIY